MASKRYPIISEDPAAERSMVNEARPKVYGRQSGDERLPAPPPAWPP